MGVEQDCILSRQGDITVVYEVHLPEIFTLADPEYEAFHQAWVKALKVLPSHSVFHKQDWFIQSQYQPDFTREDTSFLSRCSERFFNERPYLDHHCYVLLTKKPAGRQPATSLFSSLLRRSLVPQQVLSPQLMQDFLDQAGQFQRILEDSGLVRLQKLQEDKLLSHQHRLGLIEQYCYLAERDNACLMKDIAFGEGIRIGDQHCQLYTLGEAEDLPALCGSRMNYDKYSTDRTKFSIGFAASLGQLLPCNHIYNQYIFLEDARQTLQQLERKRLRLQSLSAYSRHNTLAREATNDFLNEALKHQRLPVKAHFNLLVWTDNQSEEKI
jgi:conjugation system TraG family ATPase